MHWNVPSVSLLTVFTSSSLVTCLCPNDELAFDAVDCIVLEEVAEFKVEGNNGLHGEWELAEVLVEAVKEVDGYKSWLNC